MTLSEFTDSLKNARPPQQAGNLLQALWYDRKSDWEQAHTIIQDIESRDAAAIHAYLHRKEGDPGNAAYWYRRAGSNVYTGTLDDEWKELVEKELR